MSETARRGRPPRITRADIAQAVIAVGFADLTFAAVREHLGVGESTLFRHAPDRDELVRIGLERALADVAWPALDSGWETLLRDYAHAAWQALAVHPGSATEIARGVVPVTIIELFDAVCAALMREGFTADQAVLAGDLVFDLAADNRRGVEHLDQIVHSAGPDRAAMHANWDPMSGAIRTEIQAAIVAEPHDWFAAKLEVVLAGIATQLAPPRANHTNI